jgi:hypothetical protein
MKKINLIALIIFFAAIILGIWALSDKVNYELAPMNKYSSEKFGISFKYPKNYFLTEIDESSGQRRQYAIVIMEDTPFNRSLVAGEIPDTDGPPTITISLFQNNLDNYTAQSFVEGTSFSNFKLSDGDLKEIKLGGESALRYRATGLWENENVVVALPDYVYMFTVFFDSPDDHLVRDFEGILKSVKFTPVVSDDYSQIPTSADDAPPGSIHNLPLPPAVAAVRKHISETQGVSDGLVIILTAYERDWIDSCLGLASAEEFCAQVITPGWEVTAQAGGRQFMYRTNFDGSLIRLER